MSTYEQRLRTALAESFTPGGVDAIMASKLRIPGYPGAKSRTVAEHVADGDGERLIDWAWSLEGMVAT